ncbi:MAG: type I-A CRISPR-associated protein Cas4/Csa1 [Desulfurococcaceae archaeon]|nr:type I-A CRISPR-associated protein Cas4/Csa1 [Desulfurococcaceae archaeon]
MPIPSYVMLKELRKLHMRRYQDPIDESLRGWNWDRPPVKPRAYLGLTVSEVASYCPTKKDVWLRRVVKAVPETNEALKLGSLIHDVIHTTIECFRRYVSSGVDILNAYNDVVDEVLKKSTIPEQISNWVTSLVKYIVIQLLAEVLWSSVGDGINPWLPWISEVRVDGSLLGLSKNLRIDAITGSNVVVDFKVAKPSENHRIAITAYAMALEANLEVPIDYGLIIYVNGLGNTPKVSVESLYISSDLRKDFIDTRDELIDMIISEREPPKATSCSPTCPFKNSCR